jgi:hypothetical protein
MSQRGDKEAPRWLLLIHQIPPAPAYFRAKVGKRLQRLGAVAIKNSVYVLPLSSGTQEDFQWLAREIVTGGGEATLCQAHFVEGLRDDQIEALFHAARDVDYAQIAEEVRGITKGLPSRVARDDDRRTDLEATLARMRKRVAEVTTIDFFAAPGRVAAESTITSLERRLASSDKVAERTEEGDRQLNPESYRRRTWVTRKNVHIDRIACAWLVRRFIDAEATFKFVPGQGYRAAEGEVTFDMYEADFTHVGDRCSFETFVERFALREAGLGTIGEIVHDVDVKDGKFERTEAPGIASLIAGIALAHRDDEARIEVGRVIFDALLELYRHRRTSGGLRS